MAVDEIATHPSSGPARFSDVDGSGDADTLIRFLDEQAEQFRDRRRAQLASTGVSPGDRVIDVGCGPGTDSFELETLAGPEGSVVGVDASEAMIAEARRRAGERRSAVEFRVADARALPFAGGAFDIVRSSLVLMHIADPITALREMVRVVRPGGRVVCSEPDHQMAALDTRDVELGEWLVRDRFARAASPRIGRQLYGLMVDAGLVDVDIDLVPVPFTDWARFTLLLSLDDLVGAAVTSGVASAERVRELWRDLEARAGKGRFFGCSMLMRCRGTKPG